MKRLIAFALVVLLCATNLPALAKGKYVTIAELYDQTRDGWQAEYTAPPHKKFGGIPDAYTFMVDVPIQVPNVDKMPIIELVINQDVHDDATVVHLNKKQVRNDGHVESNTLVSYEEPDVGIHFSADMFPVMADGQAENNPLTPEDAAAFYQMLAEKYFGVDNMRLRAFAALGTEPQYSTNEERRKYQVEYYTTLEKGLYVMTGEQCFEGIPLLASGNSWWRYFPMTGMTLELQDEAHYRMEGTTLRQTGVLHDDVPLLPWRDIQKAFENECLKSNRMYDVYSVELGYQLVITRKGPKTGIAGRNGELKTYPAGTFEEIYHARPVWVFHGFAPLETAGALLEQQIEDQRDRVENPSPLEEMGFFSYRGCMIINAQTGKLINFTSDSDKLDDVFPKILQWKDVK